MENAEEKSPWLVLLAVAAASGVGLLFGAGLGGWLAMEIYAGDTDFQDALLNPSAAMRVPLLLMQAVTTLFGLLLVPALVWWRLRKNPVSAFFTSGVSPVVVLLVVLLVVAFAVVDSVIIQWNKDLDLPAFLGGFESWAKAKEAELERLMKLLIQFDSGAEWVTGFVVIAVVAGITEEFFFRGLIQAELARALRSHHLAIWLSAFLFSAIHFQFFGFFPRLLLGALFGYLYAWSGNLWIPILAHTVNNAFSLALMRLSQTRQIPLDVENEAVPWPVALFFLVVCGMVLNILYRRFNPSSPS